MGRAPPYTVAWHLLFSHFGKTPPTLVLFYIYPARWCPQLCLLVRVQSMNQFDLYIYIVLSTYPTMKLVRLPVFFTYIRQIDMLILCALNLNMYNMNNSNGNKHHRHKNNDNDNVNSNNKTKNSNHCSSLFVAHEVPLSPLFDGELPHVPCPYSFHMARWWGVARCRGFTGAGTTHWDFIKKTCGFCLISMDFHFELMGIFLN